VHFSTQAPGRRPGAHAEAVDLESFARFADEVRDEERSALLARDLLAARVG
jgi:hypothetical protein